MSGLAPGARVTRALVLRSLAALRGGEVVLTLPGGEVRHLGDSAGPSIAVEVRSDRIWTRLARRTRVGLGEGFVAGDWDTPDLVGFFSLIVRNLDAAAERQPLRSIYRVQELRPHLPVRQTPERARESIHAHYDLGNDLFRLFLDESMTYSCAYWHSDEDTLEQAQRQKLERICTKLGLGPDDHVLEIGCGWGSFALHAASTRGCRVTAVTISAQQAELARERVAAAGLADRVTVLEQDYRLLEGSFTRIASIEMFEAIGLAEYETFFRTCDRLLAPDGLACVQTIAIPDERFERYRRTPDWIQQHIFPGSLLPSLESIARATARTRLMLHGVEEIGFGYARTLREWRERFLARLDEVRALGYDERFVRTWLFYLGFCEAAFATRALRDVQLVLTRSFNDSLPTLPTERITF